MRDPEIQTVGQPSNGREGIELGQRLQPAIFARMDHRRRVKRQVKVRE